MTGVDADRSSTKASGVSRKSKVAAAPLSDTPMLSDPRLAEQ
jgi:hypothetical protein